MTPARDLMAEERSLLRTRLRVPKHVVYREFAVETVILNVERGSYHGLNATGGQMLTAINTAETVDAAAQMIAKRYHRPLSEVRADICDLCARLLDRELLVTVALGAANGSSPTR
jgi:hypothetical protein